ncbi:hypothetical protein OKW60_004499 [Vibrio alginolyticus]|nr:hypothetical protein [Vibrio alginolyticus]
MTIFIEDFVEFINKLSPSEKKHLSELTQLYTSISYDELEQINIALDEIQNLQSQLDNLNNLVSGLSLDKRQEIETETSEYFEGENIFYVSEEKQEWAVKHSPAGIPFLEERIEEQLASLKEEIGI